jgi:hypothetical protein
MAEKKYPFIDFSQIGHLPGMLYDYGAYKLIEKYNPKQSERKTKVSKTIGGSLDLYGSIRKSNFVAKFPRVTPKVAVWKDFSDGASKLDRLYTVEIHGAEMPVYMAERKDPEPTDEMLEENIKFARDKKESQYNATEKTVPFYDEDWTRAATNKYTDQDFELLEDKKEFRKWLVRDDTTLWRQFGKLDKEKELQVDNAKYNVKVYKKPGRFITWLYWAAGDQMYNAIDTLYNPLQKWLLKGPKDLVQYLLKLEYKAISGARRTLFSRQYPQLAYDLTE